MSAAVSPGGLQLTVEGSVCHLQWDRGLGARSHHWDLQDSKFASTFHRD